MAKAILELPEMPLSRKRLGSLLGEKCCNQEIQDSEPIRTETMA